MYLEFFHLREFPFAVASDERFFYESSIHREALANMVYTIQQRKGMVLITGEVGAGKTFLGSMLANRLGLGVEVGVVRHPAGSGRQLLRAVADSLGMGIGDSDQYSLTSELERRLLEMHRRGRVVAVLIDEVQDLPDESLEEVRLMWNWESQGQRLLQIVLIGQPELRQRLRLPRWESLRQRIVLSYHLGRLGAEDAGKYVQHRLRVAADEGCQLSFQPEAIAAIHAATKGVPRLINILCDNALLTAYARGTHEITRAMLVEIGRDMICLPEDGLDDDEPVEQMVPSRRPTPAETPVAPEPVVFVPAPTPPEPVLPVEPAVAQPVPDPVAPPLGSGATPFAVPGDGRAPMDTPMPADGQGRGTPQVGAEDPPESEPQPEPEAPPAEEADPEEQFVELLEADPSRESARRVLMEVGPDGRARHLAMRVLMHELLNHLTA